MRITWMFCLLAMVGCAGSAKNHAVLPLPLPSVAPPAAVFDAAYASKAAALSLHCTAEAKPHYYEKFTKQATPRADHPAFFGCYDWHSSVHGHWALLRILHAYPAIPERGAILARLNAHLRPEKIARELAYFKAQPGFEMPYGYAWFLRLAAELRGSPLPEAKAWAEAIAPLESYLVGNFLAYLGKINRPMRSGTHSNTAFAMNHIWDYSVAAGNGGLRAAIAAKARALYAGDANCPLAYEPSSGDFISPCFEEADLLRRVLPSEEFRGWFAKFLPVIAPGLVAPVLPLDSKDYILGHLIGLMYQKATAMRGVATALGSADPAAALLRRAADAQAATGWRLMFDSGYGGTHWLASFAVFYFVPPEPAR